MEWNAKEPWGQVERNESDGVAEVYGELLARAPVMDILVPGASAKYTGIFGFEELRTVTSDPATFSSTLADNGSRIIPLEVDPPEHATYRKLLNPLFAASKIARTEPATRVLAASMIDELLARGVSDFAQDFAYPFPIRVLCTFLGIPDDEWRIHHDFVTSFAVRSGEGLAAPDQAKGDLVDDIFPYINRQIAIRHKRPGTDAITDLVMASLDGEVLPDGEIARLVRTIMMAGHITTTGAMSNIALRLAKNSELQSFLRANPHRIPDAIEECLRIDAPQQAMPRRCTRDTVVGHHDIKAGDYLLLNFGSANVDPRRWEDAQRYDIDRGDRQHVAFGRGIHSCLGAPLARMELRVAVEELLARTSNITIAGSVRRVAWPRLGAENLPVLLKAAR